MVAREGKLFFGRTPELLFSFQGEHFYTDALAGTYPRGASDEEDERLSEALLADPKERAEHDWVVQMILAKLDGVTRDIEIPETPRIRRLANVQHLHSPVKARLLESADVDALIDLLHPTPAVGGWPKKGACQAILDVEGWERGLYAGVIGVMDPKRRTCWGSVAIRSGFVSDDRLEVYAGAGIVNQSEAEREANETKNKLAAILGSLA